MRDILQPPVGFGSGGYMGHNIHGIYDDDDNGGNDNDDYGDLFGRGFGKYTYAK